MKKIVQYPCIRCKKLSDGNIKLYQFVNDNLTIVRFVLDCCKLEIVKYFNKSNLRRYIKEI